MEKEKFKWPRQHTASVMALTDTQWEWLLSGYDVVGHEALSYVHCAG
ncbi:MAG: transposase [Aestuariibacter sp.]|nr:transposase [Aestuariibacter sp.]